MIKKVKNSLVWFLLLVVGLLIVKPTKRKERYIMDWTGVEILLKKAFGENCNIFLVDQKYKIPSLENLKKFLKEDKTDVEKYVPEWFDCPVPLETAYAFGLFFADGYCNLLNGKSGGSSWRLTNTNISFLEKAKIGFEKLPEENLRFEVQSFPCEAKGTKTNYGERKEGLKHLVVRVRNRSNDGTRGKFIKSMRNMFYLNEAKLVPAPIIDAPLVCKRAFLEGVIDGDGHRNKFKGAQITVQGRAALFELQKIMKDLRWNYQSRREKRANNTYTLICSRKHEMEGYILDCVKENESISIKEIGRKLNIRASSCSGYIRKLVSAGYLRKEKSDKDRRSFLISLKREYNLCDDFSFRLMGQFSIPGWSDIAFGIAVSEVHAYNCVIAENDGDIKAYLIEPQADRIIDPEDVEDEGYQTVFVMM